MYKIKKLQSNEGPNTNTQHASLSGSVNLVIFSATVTSISFPESNPDVLMVLLHLD